MVIKYYHIFKVCNVGYVRFVNRYSGYDYYSIFFFETLAPKTISFLNYKAHYIYIRDGQLKVIKLVIFGKLKSSGPKHSEQKKKSFNIFYLTFNLFII